MPKKIIQLLYRVVKWLFPLLSIFYLSHVLYKNLSLFESYTWPSSCFSGILGGLLLTTIGYVAIAISWAMMVAVKGDTNSLLGAIAVYTRTSIYKYLPGNIFHLVGRNIMGSDYGLTQSRIVAATLYESLLSILSSVIIVGCSIALIKNLIPYSTDYFHLATGGAVIALLVIGALRLFGESLTGRISTPKWRTAVKVFMPPQRVVNSMVIELAAFGAMTFAATFIWSSLTNANAISYVVGVCYLAGWIVGYVIPGAPGGMGVREAFLVYALSRYANAPDVLVFAGLMRIIVIAADGLLLVLGIIISAKLVRDAGPSEV